MPFGFGKETKENISSNFDKEDLKSQVIDALKTVYDPEIPVNIYDLGLIYNVDIDDDLNTKISMTLTTPGCPVAETFPLTVETAARTVEALKSVEVELVWEPPWSQDNMSEAAKLQLGLI